MIVNGSKMKRIYLYDKQNQAAFIENFDKGKVLNHIRQLDGVENLQMLIHMPSGVLILSSSPSGRFHVSFANKREYSGWMVDDSQPTDEYTDFLLANGRLDETALRETVSREVAEEVAVYFVENDVLPPDHQWGGFMDDYPFG